MSEGGFVVMRLIKVTTVFLMLSATAAAQGRVATTTSLTSSLNPAALGQTITLRATVTDSAGRPATGSVRFSGNLGSSINGSSILVNGVASLSVSTLAAGTHHITAHYSGDRLFRPSRSDQLDQVVVGGVPTLSLSPATRDFGAVVVGHLSAPQGFMVSNTGTAPLGPLSSSNFTFSGANPGDFVVNSTCPSPIAPGASCLVDVNFAPQAAGVRTATFTVTASPGGTATATVSGIGLAAVPVISLSPATQDYGEVVVGHLSAPQGFIVTNTGTAPLGPLLASNFTFTGANPGDFLIDDTCQVIAPGASCVVDINFVPLAAGSRAATFTVTASPGGTATAALSGTGLAAVPVISLSPVTQDYGAVVVGHLSAPQGFVVTNSGTAPLGPLLASNFTFTGANPADFVVNSTCPFPIAPGASCLVDVDFAPQAAGARSATFTVTASPGGTATAALTGTGVAAVTAVTLTPASYDFGSVPVGQSVTAAFTLTNTGTTPIGGLGVLGGSIDFGADLGTCPAGDLAPNTSCTVHATFRPTGTGTRQGTLTIARNNIPLVSAQLSGTGVASALTITPASYDFGSVPVGQSVTAAFTLTNSGTTPIGGLGFLGGSIDFPGADLGTCPAGDLAPTASCTVHATFRPTGTGTREGSLTIAGFNIPLVSAHLSGTGVASTLTITPATYDFGSVLVGQSVTAAFTLTNTGTTPIGGLGLLGGSSNFGADMGNCPASDLAPNASCTVHATFSPTVTGTRQGFLTIAASNIPLVSAQLRGTGIADISLTPASHDFGSVPVGQSVSVAFTLTNSGVTSTGLLSLLGNVAPDMSADLGDCPASGLDPGTSCTVSVTFHPTAAGTRQGFLVVAEASGINTAAQVSGTGIPGTVTGVSVVPASLAAGATGVVNIAFTTANDWPADGHLTLGFPGGFDVAATSACTLIGGSGSCTVTVQGQVATLRRSGGAIVLAGSALSITVGTIRNPPVAGPTGTFALATQSGNGIDIDRGTAPGVTVTAGTLTVVSVTPASLATGATGNVNVAFTTANPWPADGRLAVVFPSGFDVSATSGVCTLVGGSGNCFVSTLGQVLTLSRSGGASVPAGSALSVTFDRIRNPLVAGSTGSFTLTTQTGSRDDIDVGTAPGILLTGAVLALTPSSDDFGSVVVGQTSPPVTFTLTNTGNASSGPLHNLALSGANPADFVLNVGTCPAISLAPLASCTLQVAFAPQSAGSRTATLIITASPGGSASAAVSGTGVAAVAVLSLRPTPYDFGSVFVGQTSPPVTFTVSNTGTASSGLLSASFTGAPDFSDAGGSSCGPATLLTPGGTCQLNVRFAPQVAGIRTATLTVTASPGNSVSADLTGTGRTTAALAFTPASHDFGSRQVNFGSGGVFFFTVTNGGSSATPVLDHIDITGPGAADFFADAVDNHCQGVSLAPGASCSLSVGFLPHTVGVRNATVTVSASGGGASGSAQVTGTGVPPTVFAVTPPTINFGSVDLGQTSPVFTYTLTNTGPSPGGFFVTDSFVGVGKADYNQLTSECWGNPVNVGASCRFTVSFSPKAGGARPATLTMVFEGGTATVDFTGFGTSPNALLAVSPDSQDFGLVFLGASSAIKTVTVTNVGHAISGPLVNFLFSGPGAYEFGVVGASNQCSGLALAPGGSCTIGLTFTPQVYGVRKATLAISDGGLGGTVTLTGTGGVAPVVLTIAPDTFRFGSVPVGQSSAPATFTLTNPFPFRTGTINSFALTGVNTSDYIVSQGTCGGAALDPGGTCTFSVTFAPQVGGGHPSTLTVTTAAGEAGATQLRGFGLAPAVLSVTPASHDFGFAFVGQGAGPVTFTVTNSGGGTSGVLSYTFSGTNASDFSYLDTGTCLLFGGQLLAPGASCTIDLIFLPHAYGPRSASLTIAGEGLGGGTATVNLTGGITPGGVLTITPTSTNFGTIPVGAWTLPTEFTVTNTGTTIAFLSGVFIDDPAGTDYALEPGSYCAGTPFLEVGASCAILVQFQPQRTGPLPATLRVVYDLGTVSASLTGTGGPPSPTTMVGGGGTLELTSFTAADAARDLLGVPTLTAAHRAYLDGTGNHNGAYDLGDLLAFFDRHHIKLSPALLAGPASKERVP